MNKTIHPGLRVQTLQGEPNTEEQIGADMNTWGCITDLSSTDADGMCHWGVVFGGTTRVLLTDIELHDTLRYKLAEPETIAQLCLALKWGYQVAELSMYDDLMINWAEQLTSAYDSILLLTEQADAGYVLLEAAEAVLEQRASGTSDVELGELREARDDFKRVGAQT